MGKKRLLSLLDEQGNTALHYSGKSGNKEIIELLSENSYQMIEIKNKEGETVLHIAARFGNGQAIHTLTSILQETLGKLNVQKMQEIINLKSNKARTALHESCAQGYVEICVRLIEYGASGGIEDVNGDTPLHLIIQTLNHKKLIESKPVALSEMEFDDAESQSASKQGANANNGQSTEELIRLLLQSNASAHSTNQSGVTPLHWASRVGNVTILRILLDSVAEQSEVAQKMNKINQQLALNNQKAPPLPPSYSSSLDSRQAKSITSRELNRSKLEMKNKSTPSKIMQNQVKPAPKEDIMETTEVKPISKSDMDEFGADSSENSTLTPFNQDPPVPSPNPPLLTPSPIGISAITSPATPATSNVIDDTVIKDLLRHNASKFIKSTLEQSPADTNAPKDSTTWDVSTVNQQLELSQHISLGSFLFSLPSYLFLLSIPFSSPFLFIPFSYLSSSLCLSPLRSSYLSSSLFPSTFPLFLSYFSSSLSLSPYSFLLISSSLSPYSTISLPLLFLASFFMRLTFFHPFLSYFHLSISLSSINSPSSLL